MQNGNGEEGLGLLSLNRIAPSMRDVRAYSYIFRTFVKAASRTRGGEGFIHLDDDRINGKKKKKKVIHDMQTD